MQTPAGVKIVSVQEVPYLTAGNQAGTKTQYRYMVGEYGPFTLSVTDAENTNANVNSKMQEKVNLLTGFGLKVS